MLVLIVPPGGGDALQAAKKGIMELADLVVVSKADGDLESATRHTMADYSGSMQFIRQKHVEWRPPVMMMSARTGSGIDDVLATICEYHSIMVRNGALERNRSQQLLHWMKSQFVRQLIEHVEGNAVVSREMEKVSADVAAGVLTPRAAPTRIMSAYLKGMK
jgi:LAO/AO transport system kinase